MRRALPFAALLLAAPAAADTLDSQARAMFDTVFGEYCGYTHGDGSTPFFAPQRYSYDRAFDAESTPETFTVFHFFCFAGAYNIQSVVLLHRPYEGIRPAAFATPDLDIAYDPANWERSTSMQVAGWGTTDILINAEIDPGTGSIFSRSAWRGLGDASSEAIYELTYLGYRLLSYRADPDYDGEINLIPLYEAPLP